MLDLQPDFVDDVDLLSRPEQRALNKLALIIISVLAAIGVGGALILSGSQENGNVEGHAIDTGRPILSAPTPQSFH